MQLPCPGISRPRRLALALVAGTAACQIDLGPQADAAACAPSPDYFVSDVWPRYLVQNNCANQECHDAGRRGHGTLRFTTPGAAPTPGTPLASWPSDWRENYLSAIQLVDCDTPLASRLLTMPLGVGNLHPAGPVVVDRAAARTVFETWLAPSR